MKNNKTLPTTILLDHIKRHFYDTSPYPKKYYKDQRMLLYAITWPATWLEQRALPISSEDYQKLITKRLHDIVKHGDPKRFHKHFPIYLLKTLQDWFAHHGDTLYDKLKHIRNHLSTIQAIINQNATNEAPEDIVTPMAQAHAILAKQYRRKNRKDTRQLKLF